MSEFFAMDGHGGYIWTAYGATALVIGALALRAWMRARRMRRALAEEERRADDQP